MLSQRAMKSCKIGNIKTCLSYALTMLGRSCWLLHGSSRGSFHTVNIEEKQIFVGIT